MSLQDIARPNPNLATPELASPTTQRGKVWGKQWQKGQSGNPGGKSKAKENIVDIARQATPKAMRTMIAIMENEKAPYSVRAYCADKVLDRAWGRPVQQTNLLVGSTQRSLSQLSDAELLQIIEASRISPVISPALSPPVIDQPQVEVEPTVEPELLDAAETNAAPHADQGDRAP